MGCDGGTIPTRDELVKTAKRPEQVISIKNSVFQTSISDLFTERQGLRQIIQMATLCFHSRTIRQTSGCMRTW